MLFKFLHSLLLMLFINVGYNATDEGYRGDDEKEHSLVLVVNKTANTVNDELVYPSVKNISLLSGSANFSSALLSVFLTDPKMREFLWYYSSIRSICSSTHCIFGSLRNFLPDDHCLNNKWFVENGIFPEREKDSNNPNEQMSQNFIWAVKNSLRAYCYMNAGSELVKGMFAGEQPSSFLIFSYFFVVGVVDFIDYLNAKK